MVENYYDVLGVSENATAEDLKTRFRFLSQAYHPDKFLSDSHRQRAEEEFKRINQAYQTLSDATKRARYDALRTKTDTPRPQPEPQTAPAYKPPVQPKIVQEEAKAFILRSNISARNLLSGIGLCLVIAFLEEYLAQELYDHEFKVNDTSKILDFGCALVSLVLLLFLTLIQTFARHINFAVAIVIATIGFLGVEVFTFQLLASSSFPNLSSYLSAISNGILIHLFSLIIGLVVIDTFVRRLFQVRKQM